ncbi:hypothetical protein EV424DRAFT_1544799 [Suillus variegatus]|nr:hypothetical protein EV424DRAFT_1544799 [Suillus variegatus]
MSGHTFLDQSHRLESRHQTFQFGPLLQHEVEVNCAALSADGKLLVTGCQNQNAYTWDIHAILKEAGLEDLLPSSDVMDADATQAMDDELLPDFFYSSGTYGNYHPSSSRRPRPLASSFGSVNTLFGRLSFFFRRSQTNTEPQQRSRRALLSRGPRIVEVAAVKDREVIFTAPQPPEKTQQQTQSPPQGSSTTQPALGANSTTLRPRHPYSPIRLLGHLVLFLCCCTLPQHANRNAQPIQQEDQPQCQVHAQALSSQSHPPAPTTSVTPTALDSTHTIAPGAASA